MSRALLTLLALLLGLAPARAQEQAPGYRISGRVINADSGAPLAGANVAILPVVNGEPQVPAPDQPPNRFPQQRGGRGFSPRDGFRSAASSRALEAATTDNDGNFAFTRVPAGKYSLEASHRGFVTASYQEHGLFSTAIVTGAGISSDGLVLKLSPGAVISGSVIDTAGDPIEQPSVSLYRQSDDGLGSIHMYRSTNADDLGFYEFAHLPPGTYFVSAKGRVWYATQPQGTASTAAATPGSNLDLVYPRAYYADATDSSSATPIPVRGGERLRIDLHMQAVPAVHITAPLQGADTAEGLHTIGRPFQVTESVFGDQEPVQDLRVFNRGTPFSSASVAPGEYEVELEGRTIAVNAAGDTVLDPQAATAVSQITGQIGPAPGVTLPESVDVTLEPAGGQPGAGQSGGRRGSALSEVAHQGAFHFDHVPPGTYEIEVHTDGRPMAVVDVAASGARLDGHSLQVGAQPVALAATVAPETAILSGFAREQADDKAGASGVMVVLVPKHLSDHALYRRDQSDSDGSFSLRQVAPGSYTLVAIRDGWDLEWARPEVIAHYLAGGEPVVVTTTNSAVVTLPKPVIVQSR